MTILLAFSISFETSKYSSVTALKRKKKSAKNKKQLIGGAYSNMMKVASPANYSESDYPRTPQDMDLTLKLIFAKS